MTRQGGGETPHASPNRLPGHLGARWNAWAGPHDQAGFASIDNVVAQTTCMAANNSLDWHLKTQGGSVGSRNRTARGFVINREIALQSHTIAEGTCPLKFDRSLMEFMSNVCRTCIYSVGRRKPHPIPSWVTLTVWQINSSIHSIQHGRIWNFRPRACGWADRIICSSRAIVNGGTDVDE